MAKVLALSRLSSTLTLVMSSWASIGKSLPLTRTVRPGAETGCSSWGSAASSDRRDDQFGPGGQLTGVGNIVGGSNRTPLRRIAVFFRRDAPQRIALPDHPPLRLQW